MISVWLRSVVVAGLVFSALPKLRLLRMYAGKASLAGQYMAPNPSLRADGLKSLAGTILAIPIVLLVRWPALVTYLLGLAAIGQLIELYRCARAVPPYSDLAPGGPFEKQRSRQVRMKALALLIAAALAGGSALLLGI